MAAEPFDMKLRALRRDRAFRRGARLFLHERAFADCLDRLSFVTRTFDSALLIGCPDPEWPRRLSAFARDVQAVDPGPLFARSAGGGVVREDRWTAPPGTHDLCVAIGTLETVNDLPVALRAIGAAMTADALLIGAMAGGDSLPRLRAAMFAADRLTGSAAPHVHPRIDGPTLAALLGACGFTMPVVDVDRVSVSYRNLATLVADLRSMGATNVLHSRERRPLTRAARQAAEQAFAAAGDGERTVEQIDILNFAAWTPQAAGRG